MIATPFSAPRLLSLDVLRGATVALMILVNNPGSWTHLYPPLAHAEWHGLTPTDLVFPFFLFAVGNALALVMPALLAGPPGLFWRRVAQRTLLIFLIGLALNASPFVRWDAAGDLAWRSWDTLRLMGVLQRIALAFGAAALIVWVLSRRTADAGPRVLWACTALLLGYWVAMLALGDRGDPYSLEGFFGTAIDRALLGAAHLYRGEGVPFDPEGLASTVPAVAQVLLGWWVGDAVRNGLATAPAGAAGPAARDALVARLAAQATLLLALGWLWSLVLPLNKKLWTPSYVLLSTGLAMLALVLLLHLLEQRPAIAAGARRAPVRTALAALGQGVVRLAAAFGRNALAVFVLSGLVPRVLALWRWPDGSAADGTPVWITPLPWLYRRCFADLAPDPRLGSLAFALANLALYAALAWWLDRRRIYIRV